MDRSIGKSFSQESKQCYCFNRDCQQPKNIKDADTCVNCGSNLRLQNRYRALDLIGQGGFGRTFKGIDESQPFQPYCAIKQFWHEANRNEKAAELFKQEAKRLEVLGEHPHIPSLIDNFVENKEQYLVQEFISGANLAQESVWHEAEIRELLLSLLPLIRFVHSHGVIHRDIKPENIIRDPKGMRKHNRQNNSLTLVDFGAAKVVTKATRDRTGTVIGTAAYTAPEQLKGKAVFASDIYSLGVTCVHLLTNVHPFNLFDSNENSWNWRHYLSQPVSKQLGKVLDKMLSAAINQRYQSADEVLQDLSEVPNRKQHTAIKFLGSSAAAVLILLGLRALVAPVAQQVSTPQITNSTVQQPSKSPKISSDLGGLYSYDRNGKVETFPLTQTSVDAKIAGNIARVEVTQTFTNPNSKPLEAIYKFPLPDNAAVGTTWKLELAIALFKVILNAKQKRNRSTKPPNAKAKRQAY